MTPPLAVYFANDYADYVEHLPGRQQSARRRTLGWPTTTRGAVRSAAQVHSAVLRAQADLRKDTALNIYVFN